MMVTSEYDGHFTHGYAVSKLGKVFQSTSGRRRILRS